MAVTDSKRFGLYKAVALSLKTWIEDISKTQPARPIPRAAAFAENKIPCRGEFIRPGRLKPPLQTCKLDREAYKSTSLAALTAAALALPGLGHAEDEVNFQYGHYEESARSLGGEKSPYQPIQVESLHGNADLNFLDRWKFGFNYIQDTWSGATPIATLPLAFGGNSSVNHPVSGASPYIQGSKLIAVDKQFNPLSYNASTGTFQKDLRLVHTLASASPETRKQGDFKLGYDWDDASLNLGGGISQEPDYDSRFVNLGGRADFNQKRTSLNLGLSYTNSDTLAKLDPNAYPYINTQLYDAHIDTIRSASGATHILNGKREDWSSQLGLTQVLSKNKLVSASFGYTRSSGYMSNPYKVAEFLFVDPNQTPGASGELYGNIKALLESRPDLRNQWTWDTRYVQFIESMNASLHLGYRFYKDDWGINAHTFEADWAQPLGDSWTITPRIRYYSQDAADFYAPYFLSKQASSSFSVDANGNLIVKPFDIRSLQKYYSSDQRLSGYGGLSGGINISKKLSKAVSLETSFEYYTHQGALKLGGGGEGNYADFNFYSINAALKVNLSAPHLFEINEHAHHHHDHMGSHGPAGVMFDHMINQADGYMVGYRYMYDLQGGGMLHGTQSVADSSIVAQGCGNLKCSSVPQEMSMHMHMLDIMYAPTNWLNLMIMPQFMDMDMDLRALSGAPPSTQHNHGATPHHATGGIGDTGLYALIKLFDAGSHHMHLGLGISAPTGDVNQKIKVQTHDPVTGSLVPSQQFIHYGMQLGSGTWDFKPSLTYTTQIEKLSLGAQLSATKRMQNQNESGFAFGDIFQSTAWGSYPILNWASASVRGVYSWQAAINGQYNDAVGSSGPMDFPANYGGRYWDVGFGLNATVPSGMFKGNHLGVEWLEPVYTDVNGYQLDRKGALSATWSVGF